VGFATNLNKNTITQIDKRQLSGWRKAGVRNAFKNPFEALFERQSTQTTAQINQATKNVVEEYFAAFNDRDMESAVQCCSEDIQYDDTQYPNAFVGREALLAHLYKVSNALPTTIEFVVDDLAEDKDASPDVIKVGVQWHLENSDKPGQTLPFSRGCSFYTIDRKTNLIVKGFDVPEPAPLKSGSAGITILSIATKLIEEPIRVLPLAVWITYMFVVFFSNGILPGADATQLELRTWEEVRDLSLNFFFVAPLLHLPFSPSTVHPMLEGIFNLLLSWAALFAGFLSDERPPKKANTIPFLPTLLGMQFLTSAIYLPYLVTRTSESSVLRNDNENGLLVYKEELGNIQRLLGESRGLGWFLGGMGLASLAWASWARQELYGAAFTPERLQGFIDLICIDRVGSSFLVDLAIFALFQGWLVQDDLKRRTQVNELSQQQWLANLATYVPFFGLAIYVIMRPPLPSLDEDEVECDTL